MFGVGFYAVFGLTEEPLISSGDGCMMFLWRGDQLMTRRATLPPDSQSEWTTFQLTLRDPDTLPTVPDLGRFIATSIGFTASLCKITVRIDDQVVISVSKREGASGRELLAPNNWVRRSPEGLFNVQGVSLKNVQMETELREYVPPIPDPKPGEPSQSTERPTPEPEKSNLFFRLASLDLATSLPKQLATEMERTTKKKPASRTSITMLYANADELGSSLDGSNAKGRNMSIFAGLVPVPPNQGNVIIGFRTQQTTGCSASVAAAFIPTVERESLDFVDRALAIWNRELLAVCGILARLVYEDDMGAVRMIWAPRPAKITSADVSETGLDDSDREALGFAVRRCAHALKSFGFLSPSTPHATVGNVIREWFVASAGSGIALVTTRGVVPANQARLLPTIGKLDVATILTLCKLTPVVPMELYAAAKDALDGMRRSGIVIDVGFGDVASEINSRIFSVAEVEALMRWWIALAGVPDRNRWADRIWGRLRFATPKADGQKAIVAWRTLRFFENPSKIPPDLVENVEGVLSFAISKSFQQTQLLEQFGLVELPILHWLVGTAADAKLESDAAFAEKVLSTVSKAFAANAAGSAEDRRKTIALLQSKRCVPTKVGLFRPQDAYLAKVTLFDDLPTLHLANPKSLTESICRDLGLRDHVDVGLVLARVSQLGFNHESLVRYLANTPLTDLEKSRLGQTKLFPREGGDPAKEGLWRPIDLYFGVDLPGMAVQNADLALPLLAWTKHRLRLAGEEGKLLQSLGVRTSMPYPEWIGAVSDPNCDLDKRKKLLRYFLERRDTTYFDFDPAKVTARFLPATVTLTGSKTDVVLCLPRECFADGASSVLQFPVLDAEFKTSAGKLGVPERPPMGAALQRLLASPPPTKDVATPLFAYFATRLGEISSGDFATLAGKRFIPVSRGHEKKWELMEPREVYFAGPDEQAFAELNLPVIDFGVAANSFLKACGVAEKPSPQELAKRVLRDPASFLLKIGAEKYLTLLRQLSVLPIDSQLLNEMRTRPWLLALKSEPLKEGGATPTATEDDFETGREASWVLAQADAIVLIDDPVLFNTFLPLSAPMEAVLEGFYERLGSRWISREVSEDWQVVGTIRTSEQAARLEKLLHQRAPLLLYDVGQGGGRRDALTNDLKNLHDLLNTLSVGEIDTINIKRTFRGISKLSPTTSSIARDGRARKHLLITKNVDYFDVAQALSKLLFKHPRLQDSLLLSTLLSSSLVNLKRKGFPVDRLLKNELAQVQKIAATSAVAAPPPQSAPAAQQALTSDAGMGGQRDRNVPNDDGTRSNGAVGDLTKPTDSRTDEEALSGWVGDLSKWWNGTEPTPKPPPAAATEQIPGTFVENGSAAGGAGSKGPGPRRPAEHADPEMTQMLKADLQAAINSSRPATEDTFRATVPDRPPAAPQAPMPQDYCRALLDSDLKRVGTVRGIALFCDKAASLDNLQQIIDAGGLDAFVGILLELAAVFQFPNLAAINIWWDERGSTVAFNRNRTIFCNLRYFAGLHHERAPLADAYSYWFMSVAHELAHHFVEEHNAEHEYYLSSLAETYLPRFVQLVASKTTAR